MEFCAFHQDLVWLSCFGSPDLGTTVSLRDFKGLQLLFLCLILLALRPPVPSLSGTSRRGFVHLTLVPFPDFIPQSFDALAHEFDLRHARIFHPFFIGPSLLLIRFLLTLFRNHVQWPIVHSGSFFGFAD